MTAHLLALTIGPVQDFIAAARRTRDLWFGSFLLSEISKAAAKSVRDQGGKLIFPASDSDEDLAPDSPLNVANVVVAELDEGDPSAISRAAKEGATRRWHDFADQVFSRYQSVIQANIWNDQVGDMIEFYAAWHPRSGNYKNDRAALLRLLAARKRCRDFCRLRDAPASRNRRSTACAKASSARRANGPSVRVGACVFRRENSSTLSPWSSAPGSPIVVIQVIRRWHASRPIPGYGF